MSKKEITEIINTHAEQLLDCFCPLCNKRKGINALTINTAFSILILTFRHTNIEIGCKECLKEKVKKANQPHIRHHFDFRYILFYIFP